MASCKYSISHMAQLYAIYQDLYREHFLIHVVHRLDRAGYNLLGNLRG